MRNFASKQNSFLFQDKNVQTDLLKDKRIAQLFKFTLNAQNSMGQRYVVSDKLNSYPFYLFSDFVVDPSLKEMLLTLNRTKKCHEFVIQYVLQGEIYTAVTGYIHFFGKKILHSVLKTYFPLLGREVYLDFTSNIIMNVSSYQKLFGFEVLNELTKKDILEFEYFTQFFFTSYQEKMMLCFAKEMTRELKRVHKGLTNC